MAPHSTLCTLAVCGTLIVCAAIVSSAGNLAPPPGPIASTQKTLTEVEPRIPLNQQTAPGDADSVFRISQPGSYYLTERINLAPNKHGIEIDAAAVSLDLNGLSLTGGANSRNAIEISASVPINISIRNGMIDSWNGHGIHAPEIFDLRLENLSISFCQNSGIRTGDGARITNCVVTLCTFGIDVGDDCILDSCQAIQTLSGTGIAADSGCVITNCLAARGAGTGFQVSSGSSLENCAARQNDGDGFSVFGATLRGCTARENDQYGILANTSNLLNCLATGNIDGGINSSNSVVQSCNASFNLAIGISADNCHILNNLCNSNTSTGIITFPFSNDSRIEGNHCNDNEFGFFIGTAGNLLISNSASGNDINYDLTTGNTTGYIVAAPASSAISGSTGGSGVGTSISWSNISY